MVSKGTFNVTGSSAEGLAAEPARLEIRFFNNSADRVWRSEDGLPAVVGEGEPLEAKIQDTPADFTIITGNSAQLQQLFISEGTSSAVSYITE